MGMVLGKWIFFSAVLDGKMNGQVNTAKAVYAVLRSKNTVFFLNRNIIYFFLPIFYLIILIPGIFLKKNSLFYVFIHRTRISFFLRDFPVFLIAILTKSKIVIHLVGADVEGFMQGLSSVERSLVLFCYKRASTWVILGEEMRKQVVRAIFSVEAGISNIELICIPGFYDQTYNNTRLNYCKDSISIGFMSNFIREKGVCDFIEAVRICNEERGLGVYAWIAGQMLNNDSLVIDCLEKARKKPYFSMYQPIDGNLKWDILCRTDIFILPTYYKTESLPLSLVDAMRAGCACISTGVGEIPTLLADNRGIILKSTNPGLIADKIQELAIHQNKIKMLGRNSSVYIENNFSFISFANSITKLIEKYEN